MDIFIDTSNIDEIEKWHNMGVIDGVTTNPSILLNDGVYDIKASIKKIATMVNPNPVSVEVTTDNLDEMVSEARELAAWAPNIVVKIPQITQDGVPCYGVMNKLENEGIKINATATLSFGQVLLAAKAGATYISIFSGRVSDEGGDAAELIMNSVEWIESWDYMSQILVGSIRSVGDIISAALAGAHVITIPPQFLGKMADHKYTRETVRQFLTDSKKALRIMESKSA